MIASAEHHKKRQGGLVCTFGPKGLEYIRQDYLEFISKRDGQTSKKKEGNKK